MKKIKKLAALLATLCLGFCVGAFAACGEEDSSSESSTAQIGGEEMGNETLTITVKDDKNNPKQGIKINIYKGATAVAEVTTTQNGTASLQLESGVYTLVLDDATLPTLFSPDASQKTVTIADEDLSIDFVLEDLNPDGSQAKPFACFPGEMGQFTATIPANTTYYYNAVKVVGKKIIIREDGVTVTFKGDVYTATAGELEVLIGEGVISYNANLPFSLSNTTGSELSFIIYFEDIITVEQRDLTFGEVITVSLPDSSTTIAYNWTATADGVLRIECDADRRNISVRVKDDLANATTPMDEDVLSVMVKAGAEVEVIVSAMLPTQGDSPAEIPFTAIFTPSTES